MDTLAKFLKLPPPIQHKKCSFALRELLDGTSQTYRTLEKAMHLPEAKSFEELSDRYHLHLAKANLSLKEHNLLNTQKDTVSNAPFLDIMIYLHNLRSSHNVGSILRTTEAMRLGTVCFSKTTPNTNHHKVAKTAMGCAPLVPTKEQVTLEQLKGPLIALETTENATPIFDYKFPTSFSLLLGNEEYGLSKEALDRADQVVSIPLVGGKNSLNVANAFAITAYEIRRQLVKR